MVLVTCKFCQLRVFLRSTIFPNELKDSAPNKLEERA